MYLPRNQISTLYTSLLRTTHPLSPPVLILTALTVDALCATRILASLLRRDYIPHKIQPVSGYADLQNAGAELVLPLTRLKGGEGGVVVCLGLGGAVDLEGVLGLDGQGEEEERENKRENKRGHGVEVWVVDARRPWNLGNVFGGGGGAAEAVGGGGGEEVVGRRDGVEQGRLLPSYTPGKGGIIVWDDGDIEAELAREREAFMELQKMPEIDEEDLALENGVEEDDSEVEDGDLEPNSSQSRKRKASSQDTDSEDEIDEEERPRQRRRSNHSTPIPSSPGGRPHSAQVPANYTSPTSSPGHAIIPSSPPPARKAPTQRQLKTQLLKLRRKHEATLEAYYNLGTSYSEPASSMLYSLASELGREDNDLLWLAIIGISSVGLSPLSSQNHPFNNKAKAKNIPTRNQQIHTILRDEVRRLNPTDLHHHHHHNNKTNNPTTIPTHARSPTDTAIRLSPEPRFLLIRHWSLYDSMLHSHFLSTRLHVWSEAGRKRLNKLLAKMGVSLQEAGKGFVHMDLEVKRSLGGRLGRFAEMYGLEGLVPGDGGDGGGGGDGKEGWGFVRSWGWRATLSAVDVAVVVEAVLEVGGEFAAGGVSSASDTRWDGNTRGLSSTYNSRIRTLPTPPHSEDGSLSSQQQIDSQPTSEIPDWTTHRFFRAYDALAPTNQGLTVLLNNIPTAQHLARAVLRTGSALVAKKQIRHLRSFRMGVVKEGPDVSLFTHPGALTKLAGWVVEAVWVIEGEKGRGSGGGRGGDGALVLAALDEGRGVYVVVGLGGGVGGGKGSGRSKVEVKEREERRKRRVADRVAKRAERGRRREERRKVRREILDANGIGSEDEGEESDATESDVSSSGSSADSDEDEDVGGKGRGTGLNRFGLAFQLVVEETGARVRIDSFEHSVVEVRKEDLAGFLEALSLRSVVG